MRKLLAISLLALLGACGSPEIASPAEEMHRQNIYISEITSRGIVESVNSRNVYSMHGFKVDGLYVNAGDRVSAGQVLAVLDTANVKEDLQLSIAIGEAALEVARISATNALQDARRMYDDAVANLAAGRNPHVLNAEVALNAAAANLAIAQIGLQVAQADHADESNLYLATLDSLIHASRLELEAAERNHADFTVLFEAGAISAEALRQSENALAHLRNSYADALLQHDLLAEQTRRLTGSSLGIANANLQAAASAHRDAASVLATLRNTAEQEIEMLMGVLTLAKANANLEQMELALEQNRIELQRIIDDTTVTAPIDGTVSASFARTGSAAMGLMFVIDDTDNLRIMTSVREYDIAKVHEGMEATITTDATGSGTYAGIVTRVNQAATPGLPIVEFEVEVAVTSVNTSLRIGMNARVAIKLD